MGEKKHCGSHSSFRSRPTDGRNHGNMLLRCYHYVHAFTVTIPSLFHTRTLNLEAKALHTDFVLANQTIALAGLLAVDEQALVTGLLLGLADAAWLWLWCLLLSRHLVE